MLAANLAVVAAHTLRWVDGEAHVRAPGDAPGLHHVHARLVHAAQGRLHLV